MVPRACQTHIDNVVKRPVLRDRGQNRLMVRRRVNRRQLVHARGEPASHLRLEHPIRTRRAVQPLEERKDRGVRHRRRRQRRDLLDDDVRVPDDDALRVQLLRRGEVVLLRVHEVARLEILDAHLHGEVRVRGDGPGVLREEELRGGHRRLGRDGAHWRGVA